MTSDRPGPLHWLWYDVGRWASASVPGLGAARRNLPYLATAALRPRVRKRRPATRRATGQEIPEALSPELSGSGPGP